jgi:hypothetical protein
MARPVTFYGWRVVGAAFILATFGWGLGFYDDRSGSGSQSEGERSRDLAAAKCRWRNFVA